MLCGRFSVRVTEYGVKGAMDWRVVFLMSDAVFS